tara:strand:- start:188 stop:949 length:762 start_codon:yes stop_codon:yes gene_type:complete
MNNSFSITNSSYISLFKKICETYKNLSQYLYIKITYNNINFQVIDDVKVSILDITFDTPYFNTFEINYETLICINIIDFTKILKNFKDNSIYFKLQNDSNFLYIQSDINDLIKKKFTLALIEDNTYNWININTYNTNNSQISILSKTLQTIISELHVFSDYLIIHKSIDTDILEFIIDDTHTNTYSKYELNNINFINNENIHLLISLNYLHNFKLLSYFMNAIIFISNNNPLHINLIDENININYMIAPKVEI